MDREMEKLRANVAYEKYGIQKVSELDIVSSLQHRLKASFNDGANWCHEIMEAELKLHKELLRKAVNANADMEAKNAKLVEALNRFINVDDVDKGGDALISNQGQGMDGYTKLSNYESCVNKARQAIKENNVN